MSWFGVLALIQSLVNPACIGPIVFFVGLQICEECLNFMPSRHYSAFIVGLFPSIYDWVTNISGRSPLSDLDESYDTNSPGADSWYGVLAWKRGSLLVSMVWVAMIVNVIDRQWKTATIWSLVAAFLSLFGIIHVPEAGLNNMNSPFWEQCTAVDDCWEFAYQWMFVVAYVMMGATFMILWLATKYDDTLGDPVDDESRHAFDDWFKDAYTFLDEEGNYRDARDNSLVENPHIKAYNKQDGDHDSDEAEQIEEEKPEVAKEEVDA
jgi:hypothetical protein